MKDKRYLCDWWDNKEGKQKRKIVFIKFIAIILAFIAFLVYFYEDSIFNYPEEKYKELEKVYLSYIHEETGIDMIGLRNAVNTMKEPAISEENMEITYGYEYCSVTVILDKNYKTVAVNRDANTKGAYLIKTIFSEAGLVLIGAIIVLTIIQDMISYMIYAISQTNKAINKNT